MRGVDTGETERSREVARRVTGERERRRWPPVVRGEGELETRTGERRGDSSRRSSSHA